MMVAFTSWAVQVESLHIIWGHKSQRASHPPEEEYGTLEAFLAAQVSPADGGKIGGGLRPA